MSDYIVEEYLSNSQEEYLTFINDLNSLLDSYLKLTTTARADLLERILNLIFN